MKVQEFILHAIAGKLTGLRPPRLGQRPLGGALRLGSAVGSAASSIGAGACPPPNAPPWPRSSACRALATLPRPNVRHFHQIARRQHGVPFSMPSSRSLQPAGLVPRHRPRGRHRRRASPAPAWANCSISTAVDIAGCPGLEQRATLIAVVDDATEQLSTPGFWRAAGASRPSCRPPRVIDTYGLPLALYSTRPLRLHTPTAGTAPTAAAPLRSARPGPARIEHILASPRRRAAAANG